MGTNLFETFHKSAPSDITQPFLTLDDGSIISYADMFSRTRRLAAFFASLGVKPGDRVAVQVEKSPDALLIYLSSLQCGAVYLPLNPAYTTGEIEYFLKDAEPTVFICRPEDEAHLKPLAAAANVDVVLSLSSDGSGGLMDALMGTAESDQAVAHQTNSFTLVDRSPDDAAAILYTSGTTGKPKGAVLTHDNLRSNCLSLCKLWRFTSGDRLLHALPIFHTHGLFVATNITLAAGSSIIFLPRFDVNALIKHMSSASVLMGVPTFYTRLLASDDFQRETAANMRLFISGSAPLSAETHKLFHDRTGHAILERYGMTETNMIASNPYDDERRPGSVGHSLPGVNVRITNAQGAPLPQGDIGAIEVQGPNVFKEYWRRPEKTAEEFRDGGWFVTGDLGRFDEDGYLHIEGRAKDLIISGGFNIYPAEVEAAIDACSGVAESAVIGVPHPDLGESIVAVVVRQRSSDQLSERDILADISDRLARFKRPRKIVFIDILPRNAMGKVQKVNLREDYKDAIVG
ncbi:MAG: malonyl-CoA synthase [Pseudomonadota bacterium]